MPQALKQTAKTSFISRLILLTLYIALLNSFALFLIYPLLKGIDFIGIALGLLTYILLSLPLLIGLFKTRQKTSTRNVVVMGLLIVLILSAVRYFTTDISVVTLLLNLGFYLYGGMVEENLWRGRLWSLIQSATNRPWIAYVLVTLHFLLLHVPFALLEKPQPLGFLLQVLGLGILLGALRLLTKKTTVPTFAHAAINLIVFT